MLQRDRGGAMAVFDIQLFEQAFQSVLNRILFNNIQKCCEFNVRQASCQMFEKLYVLTRKIVPPGNDCTTELSRIDKLNANRKENWTNRAKETREFIAPDRNVQETPSNRWSPRAPRQDPDSALLTSSRSLAAEVARAPVIRYLRSFESRSGSNSIELWQPWRPLSQHMFSDNKCTFEV